MFRRTLKGLIVALFLAMPGLAAVAPINRAEAWSSWSLTRQPASGGGHLLGRPLCLTRHRHHGRLIVRPCHRHPGAPGLTA